jgi:hypothetical protein
MKTFGIEMDASESELRIALQSRFRRAHAQDIEAKNRSSGGSTFARLLLSSWSLACG